MLLRFFCITYLRPPFSRQFSRQFSIPGKMSSGRGSGVTRGSGIRRGTVVVNRPPPDASTSAKGGYSNVSGQTFRRNIVSEHPKSLSASDAVKEEEWPSLSAGIGSSSKSKRRTKVDLGTEVEQRLEERPGDIGSSQLKVSPVPHIRSNEENSLPASLGKKHVPLPDKIQFGQTWVEQRLEERPGDIVSSKLDVSSVANLRLNDEGSMLTNFGKKHVPSPIKRHEFPHTQPENSLDAGETDSVLESFDICLPKIGKPLIYLKSRDKVNRIQRSQPVLRPGMVLLKGYIPCSKQVQIVKKCRELGVGPGGFYQPGYRDGAKLRLQMMCLGRNWDPETKYGDRRAVDGSEPPGIPCEFNELVKRAIEESQALIEKNIGSGLSSAGDELPGMSPDICIVNFYTTSGRLGLHQDCDESEESLRKGLPVVSFSVGDSAEFLYGDERDVEKAKKVQLDSGDVLVFGGKSRNVFHGVQSIIPNSAPQALREANLRPGRLNLTFRQY
ncbi:Alpha-ketoglutarate-dependent dioxygenase abh1 [Camellia lanceoleosa]|uniref:Alpha-ketoglutarate-dependent dioxygenase abh1 n=1 Tax=Camellia lanceoleosa TaxID=1840588 RepID=A0ACC0GC96_9ERIC|nr:Alpha-ketoglutarate-dependent dioxygenase abh1 [Camellia lanceoleosa]